MTDKTRVTSGGQCWPVDPTGRGQGAEDLQKWAWGLKQSPGWGNHYTKCTPKRHSVGLHVCQGDTHVQTASRSHF